ncbi:MAG: PilZ domain-containing protein [Gammaproteobacteria bacterium]
MGLSYADKRRDRRAPVSIEVTLSGPDCGPRHGRILNISRRGAYVTLVDGPLILTTGSAVTVRFHVRRTNLRFSRHLAGHVVRVDTDGVALTFSETGLVAAAVVEDLCFYAGLCGAPRTRPLAGVGLSE